MTVRRAGLGFAEEGNGFYVWDRDLRTLELWSSELREASAARSLDVPPATPGPAAPGTMPAPGRSRRYEETEAPSDGGGCGTAR